jgi:hypothetical protein
MFRCVDSVTETPLEAAKDDEEYTPGEAGEEAGGEEAEAGEEGGDAPTGVEVRLLVFF